MLKDFKHTIDKEEIKSFPGYVFPGEIVLIEGEEQAEEALAELANHRLMGFDTETKPSFRKGALNRVSLLQLAVEERVYLFRLNCCGFPMPLRKLLSNPEVIKVGVGIREDVRYLRRWGEYNPAGFVDLQEYAPRFGIEEKSFSKLMAIIFAVKISKRQRISNWEAPRLSEGQLRYAATDAWGALKMYQQLSVFKKYYPSGTVGKVK